MSLAARGNEIRLDGEPERVERVEKLFADLATILERGHRFRPGEVQTAIRVALEAPEASLVEFFFPAGLLASVRRMIAPRTYRQQLYLQSMVENDLVISIGPAGTGKTYLAVAMAAGLTANGRVGRKQSGTALRSRAAEVR